MDTNLLDYRDLINKLKPDGNFYNGRDLLEILDIPTRSLHSACFKEIVNILEGLGYTTTLPPIVDGAKLACYLKQFPLVKQMSYPTMSVNDNGDYCNNGPNRIRASTHYVHDGTVPDIIKSIIDGIDGHSEFLYMYNIIYEVNANPNLIRARCAIHRPISQLHLPISQHQAF